MKRNPIQLITNSAIRFMACGDNHGDMEHSGAVSVMLAFMRMWKPTRKIHWGDNFDLRCLRRGADPIEQREPLKADLEVGTDFMAKFEPDVWLRGNHDERLWDLLKCDDGKLKEYAKDKVDTVLRKLQSINVKQILPYDKRAGVFSEGHLKVVHGYSYGEAATKKHAQTYGAVIHGHTHRVNAVVVPRIEREIGRAGGCLCRLDFDYNRGKIESLAQEHGFIYGVILPDKTYHAFQAMPVNGRWVLPTETKEFIT